MSGIVAFDDLFPLKANPTTLDRVFGFDSGDGKSRGFTIQAILDLIAETPVTWTEISGRPTVFAPAAHSLGSHSNVSSGVDSATDGAFLRRVGGSWQAVTVDFYGVTNPPPADATVPDAVRGITATQIAQWNSAFGWGNHAGQYRPISYVPSWAEITGKPSTFAPSSHTLASHSDTTPLATAAEGQVIRKAAVGWEVFTPDYYSPFNPPPPDASVPDFVRDFTIGQFAGYEEKMLEFAGLPDGTLPMIKDGVPADSMLKGVMSENPFDPLTEPVEYDAFVAELLHLISTKRIKGPDAVDADDYATLGQVPDIDPAILAALNASLADSPGALNRYVSLNLLNSYGYVQEAPINGNWYARKDGAWSAFTPFSVSGTPAEGNVVTWSSGVPTWAAPSGGGGGNFIAYDVAQSLTATQKIQAITNLGLRASTVQTVVISGTTTLNNYSKTSNNLLFQGTGVVSITGIIPTHDGEELIITNRTTSFLTLENSSTSSDAANRFLGGVFVPVNSSVTLRYNSAYPRWIVTSSPIYSNPVGVAAITFECYNPIAINRSGFFNVALALKTIAGTSYSILCYNNSTPEQITFEVQNTTAAFPNANVGVRRSAATNVALVAQSPATNQFALGLYTNTGGNGAFVNNSMEWTSIGGAGFGVTAGGSPTARVDIRGRGTGTGQTLLLEASDGTDNVQFIDNGQIRFLRLPTSLTGLSANSLYIYDDGTRKYICIT